MADGGRVRTGTAVRADVCARPGLAMGPAVKFQFHFEPCLTLVLAHCSSSYTSDHFKSLHSLPLPFLSPPCAESPPSSRRGNQTSLTVVNLPTISLPHRQVHVPRPTRPSASLTGSPLVVFLAPSPGSLSQQIDLKGPQYSQSLATPHRLPRRARSHFAHRTTTVLVI